MLFLNLYVFEMLRGNINLRDALGMGLPIFFLGRFLSLKVFTVVATHLFIIIINQSP